MVSRRKVAVGLGAATLAIGGVGAYSCMRDRDARQQTRGGSRQPKASGGVAVDLRRELVRLARSAPASHNTQCWRFNVSPNRVRIHPDLGRRYPDIDPDDHQLQAQACTVAVAR